MAKNNNLGDFLKGIADKFRSKLDTADTINPQNFEDKIDAVYDAAAQKEYDTFWDAFQKNGKRVTYEHAFAYGWTNENFKPKYNIRVALGYQGNMITESNITGSLKQILNDLGVTLSFYQIEGNHYGATYVFIGTKFTELPVIDFSEAEGSIALQSAFAYNSLLETIEKVILPVNCTAYGTNTFQGDYALKNIDFGGTIKYTLSFQWSPLTADSMKNIFDHLDIESYDGTRTITVKSSTRDAYKAKYDGTGVGGYSQNWDYLVALYSETANWTFSVV